MQHEDAPDSLIRYQPAIQIYDSMKIYHQEKYKSQMNENVTPKNEEILDSILPPRDWTDHQNKLHIQYVSHQPATRDDVLQLTTKLDEMLNDRQAKKHGICQIRQELYSQTFDEIIRQVAVDSPERGLLLMRVRDEHKMTLAAYETIYQASIGYGMKKQIQSEEGNDGIEEEYHGLLKMQESLENKRGLLLSQKELLEKQLKEKKTIQHQKREDQFKFLKQQKQNMTKFLESVKIQFHNN